MIVPDYMKKIPLRCSLTGRAKVLPLEEAYSIFWSVNFAWVRLRDFFKSGGQGRIPKQGILGRIAPGLATKFIIKLLTRTTLALTIDDECLLDEHNDPPVANTFNVWAFRFGSCFDGPWPHRHLLVPDEGGIRRSAYCMRPGETWLLILGVDAKSGFDDSDVDWNVFLEPPERLEDSAA